VRPPPYKAVFVSYGSQDAAVALYLDFGRVDIASLRAATCARGPFVRHGPIIGVVH
jgi:hypothetical protein